MGFIGKVGKSVSNFFVGGIKSFIAKPSIKTGISAGLDVASVVPIAKGAKVVSVASKTNFVRNIGSKVANIFRSQAATPLKKKLGKSAVFVGAAGLGSYAITGDVPKPTIRTAAGYTSYQLNPFGALYGALSGGGRKLIEEANSGTRNILDLIKQQPKPSMDNLGMSKMSDYDRYQNDLKNLIKGMPTPQTPNFVTNITSPPSSPVNVSMPSPSYGFSPSISAGGGMGEILPLMLLLAGGMGLGGYLIGKRKKKKYKKRKKRK